MLVEISPVFVVNTKIIHGYNFRTLLNKILTFYLNAFRSFKGAGKYSKPICQKVLLF